MKIGTLKDIYRVQINPEENALYIELDEGEGVEINVRSRDIDNLMDWFDINFEEVD